MIASGIALKDCEPRKFGDEFGEHIKSGIQQLLPQVPGKIRDLSCMPGTVFTVQTTIGDIFLPAFYFIHFQSSPQNEMISPLLLDSNSTIKN